MKRPHCIGIRSLALSIVLSMSPSQAGQPPTPQKAAPVQPSLLTWAQFVQRGGSREIQVDYDLPREFRNGPVYFNTRNNRIDAFMLKQGLKRYPPMQHNSIQLNDEYIPRLYSRGEIIGLRWDFGAAGQKYANDPAIRHPNQTVTCWHTVCLMAPMLSPSERERILRSQHPIHSTPSPRPSPG